MGRHKDKDAKRRKSRYQPKQRGAFARHLASQVDSEGKNLDLIELEQEKPKDKKRVIEKWVW